jgi:hypothetical protein
MTSQTLYTIAAFCAGMSIAFVIAPMIYHAMSTPEHVSATLIKPVDTVSDFIKYPHYPKSGTYNETLGTPSSMTLTNATSIPDEWHTGTPTEEGVYLCIVEAHWVKEKYETEFPEVLFYESKGWHWEETLFYVKNGTPTVLRWKRLHNMTHQRPLR